MGTPFLYLQDANEVKYKYIILCFPFTPNSRFGFSHLRIRFLEGEINLWEAEILKG